MEKWNRVVRGKTTVGIEVYPGAIQGGVVDSGFTQKELAKKLKISTQYLNDIIHGRRFSAKILRKIEKYVGYHEGDLFKFILG